MRNCSQCTWLQAPTRSNDKFTLGPHGSCEKNTFLIFVLLERCNCSHGLMVTESGDKVRPARVSVPCKRTYFCPPRFAWYNVALFPPWPPIVFSDLPSLWHRLCSFPAVRSALRSLPVGELQGAGVGGHHGDGGPTAGSHQWAPACGRGSARPLGQIGSGGCGGKSRRCSQVRLLLFYLPSRTAVIFVIVINILSTWEHNAPFLLDVNWPHGSVGLH